MHCTNKEGLPLVLSSISQPAMAHLLSQSRNWARVPHRTATMQQCVPLTAVHCSPDIQSSTHTCAYIRTSTSTYIYRAVCIHVYTHTYRVVHMRARILLPIGNVELFLGVYANTCTLWINLIMYHKYRYGLLKHVMSWSK